MNTKTTLVKVNFLRFGTYELEHRAVKLVFYNKFTKSMV